MKDPIFKENTRLEAYYKTSDGIAFFTEHDAKTYADKLKDKAVLTVTRKGTNKAKQTSSKTTGKELSNNQKAKLRIDAIENMKTVADIETALKNETAKTVISAGKDRIAKLTAEAKEIEDDKVEDDTNVTNATIDELMLYVKDNEVPLNGAETIDEIRVAVSAYLDDPNKITVPFKGQLN